MTTRADSHRDEFHRNTPVKIPVRVATTAAGTLISSFENGDSVDGVTLATGDRILIKDQAAGADNGIYVVQASGAPLRAYDMDASDEVRGRLAWVLQGTTNGATIWACTNTGAITFGTTAITFAKVYPSALALDDLSDVNAASPADGDALTWDAGTSEWVAAAVAAGSSNLDGGQADTNYGGTTAIDGGSA